MVHVSDCFNADSTPQISLFVAPVNSASRTFIFPRKRASSSTTSVIHYPPFTILLGFGSFPLAYLFAGSLLIVLSLDVIVRKSCEGEAGNTLKGSVV